MYSQTLTFDSDWFMGRTFADGSEVLETLAEFWKRNKSELVILRLFDG